LTQLYGELRQMQIPRRDLANKTLRAIEGAQQEIANLA
jgi:hypothetical protein